MKTIANFFDLLRVKQWVKNTFIFFPILFSGKIVELDLLVNCLIAFFGFCTVASGLYVLNDYKDRHRDSLHPKKSKRPIAAGLISDDFAIFLILALPLLGFGICNLVNVYVLSVVFLYVLLHLAYNYFVKNMVILDVVFVAIGFQIRIWAGGLAAGVEPSVWLQMCVFILALFLGFNKRRYELETLGDSAKDHRDVLTHYTPYMLDQVIMVCSTLAITFYGLYSISSDIVNRIGNQNMVYSVIFVIYGMFRYTYLVHVKKLGDEPGQILATDGPLLINVLVWIGYVSYLIY